ncbi:MAG TPA: polyphenol oxidase family protein [Candidatus Dormibacteraeota bacterium]|nr:polyphenol oxidase family protein [Candidatus Dormibacteraeota bacterium]
MPAFLSISPLAAERWLVHGFSTVPMGSMGLTHAPDPELVTENRRRFARSLGTKPEAITALGAVHGADVARVDRPVALLKETDAAVTDRPGVALFATFADCYPLIAYDPEHRAVGLAHAGWRGTGAGIAGRLVAMLRREYGSAAKDLRVGIGPGICGRCYEVGPEFVGRFPPEVLKPGRDDRLLLDLSEANRLQFLEAGVRAERIRALDFCTLESDRLFSHRRRPDGTRFAALVTLR